jgi:hypothetical protein
MTLVNGKTLEKNDEGKKLLEAEAEAEAEGDVKKTLELISSKAKEAKEAKEAKVIYIDADGVMINSVDIL